MNRGHYDYNRRMVKTFYIGTMGCQMNKLDSELLADQLLGLGYEPIGDSEKANVVIFNTCSVRQHAEEKVITKIAQLARHCRANPEVVLAVVGCMAQRLGAQLLETHPHVGIVCGPGQLHRFGAMVSGVLQQREPSVALNDSADTDDLEEFNTKRTRRAAKTTFDAYLRIMRGCNKYCHYCVVPYVRGPEQSRPIEHIITEARQLTEAGARQITLLGQTVNSYKYTSNGNTLGLADVLERLHEIDGLDRLRFVTSYPAGFDERIFEAMARLPKVCPYLHLPAQSGSDRVLKAMNRRYTAGEYLGLIERAREIVSDISIAGDFIVGYCNESEDDFEATKELMRQVRYKNCFIFKYSPRPGTRAETRLADNVPEQTKRRRNTELLELQNGISYQDNQRFIGNNVSVLVEGPSKKPHLNKPAATGHAATTNRNAATHHSNATGNTAAGAGSSTTTDGPGQLIGRTTGDQIVVFNGSANLAGEIVNVKVTRASALTLFAEPVV